MLVQPAREAGAAIDDDRIELDTAALAVRTWSLFTIGGRASFDAEASAVLVSSGVAF